MADLFKLSDIKAGYLLRVTDTEKDTSWHMTIMPGVKYTPSFLAAMTGSKGTEEGGLYASGGGHYWPLTEFHSDLRVNCLPYRIDAVYGYTYAKFMLDNSPEKRELLWEREPDEQEAASTEEPKKMTLAEIEKALGHKVEITE